MGCYANILTLTPNEEKKILFVATDCTLSLFNVESGVVEYRTTIASEPISAEGYMGNNGFYVYLRDGSYIEVSENVNEYIDISHEFECRTDNNAEYCSSEKYVAVLEHNDNRVIIYTKETAAAVVPTKDAVEVPGLIFYTGEVAIDFAEEYGMDNPACVNTLFFDENKTKVFASYHNGDFVIYDTEFQEVINTIKDCDVMTGYFGKDQNGYTYIKGEDSGYVLTEDMRFVMRIPKMVALNAEMQKVYISTSVDMYEAPIYNSLDLLRLATPYMETEEITEE